MGKVQFYVEVDAKVCQCAVQGTILGHGECEPIYAHGAARGKQVGEVRDVVGYARHAHLMQFYARAAELLFGLNEVSGVGPEASVVLGHNQRARRAVEATEVLSEFPVFGWVLAAVGVGGVYNKGVQLIERHLLAKLYYFVVGVHKKVD